MTDTASASLSALGICLEEYEYPYPVRFLQLTNDLQPVAMAYMDIPPRTEANGKTVVLMHGKAFGCYYFRNVIEALTGAGYRVVAPDQIGWGKSPKPDVHYSFQLLAANTAALLDHLGVGNVAVLGHSTGGMTAARFTLTHPEPCHPPGPGRPARPGRLPHRHPAAVRGDPVRPRNPLDRPGGHPRLRQGVLRAS